MLEYMFFHNKLLEKYLAFLGSKGISYSQKNDEMGIVVSIPEDLDEELEEEAYTYYDKLLSDQEKLMEEEGNTLDRNFAALTINLSDGTTLFAPISPDILNRALSVITIEELGKITEAIVEALESRDARSICKRVLE